MNTEKTQDQIIVNEDELENVLKNEIENAMNFSWHGWRIPIFVTENGKIIAGNWMNKNTYNPELYEIIGIKPWSENEIEFFNEEGEIVEKEQLTQEKIDDILNDVIEFETGEYLNLIKEKLANDIKTNIIIQ